MKRLLIACLLGPSCLYGQVHGKQYIDSLSTNLAKAKEDTNKVNLLSELSFMLHDTNPDSGITIGQQAVSLAIRLNFNTGLARAYNNIGNNIFSKSSFQESIVYFQKALAINKNLQNKKATASNLGNIANAYLYMGSYPTALSYFHQALKICDEIGSERGQANNATNIGILYSYQKNFTKALEFHQKALRLFEKIGDKNGIATNLDNIGSAYGNLGDQPRSLEYTQKALTINRELDNKGGIATNLTNLGIFYYQRNDYEQSMTCFVESLPLTRAIGQEYYVAINLGNIGTLYKYYARDTTGKPSKYCLSTKKENIAKSLAYLEEAISLCRKNNINENLMEYSNHLADVYIMAGNYKRALECYREAQFVRDSIFSNRNKTRIDSMQMQFDYDKKTAAITAANEKRMAVAEEANRAKMKLGGMAGASLLAISFISFFYYRRTQKNKFDKEITEVRQEALNAQMSDHFIGNTIDTINNFIRVNDKEKASEYLILFSRLVRRVLENSAEKMIPLRDDLQLLSDYLTLEQLRFSDNGLKYEINIAPEIDAANALVPPMVLQVLAENAIKHGFSKTEGGLIKITVQRNTGTIECAVEDNGSGRGQKSRNEKNSTEKRTSMGSALAERLVRTCSVEGSNTSFRIIDLFDNNKQPAGTRALFTMPYRLAE